MERVKVGGRGIKECLIARLYSSFDIQKPDRVKWMNNVDGGFFNYAPEEKIKDRCDKC